MKKRLLLLLIVLLSGCLSVFAQKQNNQWYLGNYAALNFNSGAPVPVYTSQMGTIEGCASIADSATGKLLFYTEGSALWDATNTVTPNGTGGGAGNNGGLGGGSSSTQAALIVPQPGNDSLYYIFTLDDWFRNSQDIFGDGGLNFNIVNRHLHGGLGDVTVKDSLLVTPAAEKLTGTKACNGIDYWIVAHTSDDNNFYAYLLTSTGISAPVISSTGAVQGNPLGYMKFSTDGTKLASANFDGDVQIFDFNNATGVISNPITDTAYYDFTEGSPYGLSFSPDNSKLYISAQAENSSHIYQYDLLAGDSTAIIASRVTISTVFSSTNQYGGLQIGPDRKIYATINNDLSLSVIQNPNARGIACNFALNALNIDSGNYNSCSLGLPNLMEIYTAPPYNAVLKYPGCSASDSVLFTDNAIAGNITCLWNFGDPVSGAADTSTLQNTYHAFSSGGNYTITLVVSNPCGSDTIRKTITVTALTSIKVVTPSSSVCNGQSVPLTVSGASNYTWSPATGLSATTGDSVIANPTVTTIYTITANNGSCTAMATDTVTVIPAPPLIILPQPPPLICFSFESDTLRVASQGSSFTWSPSEGLSATTGVTVIANPSVSVTYTVNGIDSLGCPATGTEPVTILQIANQPSFSQHNKHPDFK